MSRSSNSWSVLRMHTVIGLAVGALALVACTRASTNAVIPRPRAGAELVGRDGLAALPTRFVGEKPDFEDKVVLVRWWTDSCPYCERSLPALDLLAERNAESGLVSLGVFHPKPPQPTDDDEVRAAATRLGWNGPLAVDEDWKALRALWLDGHAREATSATFVLDRRGRIRWVHPGPELHPSQDDPEHAVCARDYGELETVVRALLDERP